MNWNNRNTTDRAHRQTTIGLLMAALGLLALTALAFGPAGAAAAEPLNDSVEVGNDTGSVYVEATFASGIDDANATADVVVTDANGSEFATGTISGNASETVVEEWDVTDSDPTGNYSVVLTADSGVVAESDLGTFSESANGGGSGSGDADGWGSMWGVPIFVIAIGAAAGVLFVGNRRGWFEDLH